MLTKLLFSELLERAKSEKIVVHAPIEEQAKELLRSLDERRYVWASGVKLTAETWYGVLREDTCYNFGFNKKVLYGSLKFYQKEGYTIIEFEDIDFKEE